ncbi:ribosomal protein L1 [Orientia chuto str. Dubai]|uniref:Large ribosomal subunit protein uL1 n=1 Tax=Orientia chuto str. Dubai TaxID=1359168 RepID=A0A0F3MPI4_9RICK|nr:50S ribosomal protein L1 [Candidatus Orientia mediorientalis]KJV57556.1 ribosomal protein L1 [Orientia chuto str. Dubai]
MLNINTNKMIKEDYAYSKNTKLAKSKIDKNKYYDLYEACSIIKEIAFAKFNETIDIAVKLGVNPSHSNQIVRGIAAMPSGTGKIVKIAVICQEEKIDEFKTTGADIVSSFNLIEQIKLGNIDYDVYIATPAMMVAVSQVARILGPKGLMPNPKLGTVTNDIATVVKKIKSGQVEFKVDKGSNIHAGIGKVSFSIDEIIANVNALVTAIIKSKPSEAKGVYLKGIYLSTTMGPSIKLDTSSFVEESNSRR